jgi:hypothetical protein
MRKRLASIAGIVRSETERMRRTRRCRACGSALMPGRHHCAASPILPARRKQGGPDANGKPAT